MCLCCYYLIMIFSPGASMIMRQPQNNALYRRDGVGESAQNTPFKYVAVGFWCHFHPHKPIA